ncbi:MAG: LLM class flavin-dependent oxidoreductase [Candidatus Binataceae bacterium]
MKLGIEIRYQDRKLVMPMERIRHAEKIGFDAVFAPEGHGSDSLTPLAFIAAHTSRTTVGFDFCLAGHFPACKVLASVNLREAIHLAANLIKRSPRSQMLLQDEHCLAIQALQFNIARTNAGH